MAQTARERELAGQESEKTAAAQREEQKQRVRAEGLLTSEALLTRRLEIIENENKELRTAMVQAGDAQTARTVQERLIEEKERGLREAGEERLRLEMRQRMTEEKMDGLASELRASREKCEELQARNELLH